MSTRKPSVDNPGQDAPKADKAKAGATPPTSASFEEALAAVESIIERLESGEVGLAESLTAYEQGVGLINQCRGMLGKAQQQVEDLTQRLDSADQESGGV